MLELRTRSGLQVWGRGPALRIAAAAAAIAAAALYCRHRHMPMIRLDAIQLSEHAFVIFTALFLISLYAGFAESLRVRRILDLRGLVLPLAALLAVGVYKLSMFQFGGWDQGLIVHAWAYYAQGLKPYADFPCSMPPLFMAGIRFTAVAMGPRWASLATLAAAFAAVTFLWFYWLLRRAGFPRRWALSLALCVEMSTMLVCSFWWFNNTSSIAVVLLFASVLASYQKPAEWLPWISTAVSLAMVLTSKPNVAPACLIPLVLLAGANCQRRAKVLGVLAAGVALALAICRFAQMPLRPMLHAYAEIGKLRGNPLMFSVFQEMGWVDRYFYVLLAVICLLCFGAALTTLLRQRAAGRATVLACVVVALTSLEMFCTNSDIKTVDLAGLLVATAVLFIRPWAQAEMPDVSETFLAGLLSLFFVYAAFFTAIHLRMIGIGEGMYYEPDATQTIHGGYFDGLQAGPRLQRVLSETREVLDRYPARTVFFGPRMEFLYAVSDLRPMPGMPLLWDPGNLFPRPALVDYLSRFQHQDPDLLIFLNNDYTRMGLVGLYIKNTPAYRRVDGYHDLTVYVRVRDSNRQ